MIPKGKRRSKTVKKFTSSPRNNSPKTAQNTHSPFDQDKIIFEIIEKKRGAKNEILFNFTSMTNKNYNKMTRAFTEQKEAYEKAYKKHRSTGYNFEENRVDAKNYIVYKRNELTVIHNNLKKLRAIILRKAQTKKTAGKIKKVKKSKGKRK